jgi:dCMP deaminase
MSHGDWDKKYLELAKFVATWSKDPSGKVGAVVVNWDEHLEFIGYNGFPRGVLDSEERYADRPMKYSLVVHAEVNAIIKAGLSARGATIYVWPSFALPPICNECAKVVIQAGIAEVVGYPAPTNDPRAVRWLESIKVSRTMLEEAGVNWRTVDV